jgi:hypothetical protein
MKYQGNIYIANRAAFRSKLPKMHAIEIEPEWIQERLEKKRLRKVWYSMKYRCNTHTSTGENYFGRGITVCEEWYDFEVFYEWSIANGYKYGLTIDRTNNDGNYEPSNCRWATYSQQGYNRRKPRKMPQEIRDEIAKTIPNYMGKSQNISK